MLSVRISSLNQKLPPLELGRTYALVVTEAPSACELQFRDPAGGDSWISQAGFDGDIDEVIMEDAEIVYDGMPVVYDGMPLMMGMSVPEGGVILTSFVAVSSASRLRFVDGSDIPDAAFATLITRVEGRW